MSDVYKPINCSYHDVLLAHATKRTYARIHYYTELGEMITSMSVIKDVFTKNGEEYTLLATGEKIRLDRLVAVNEDVSPHHDGFMDFSCDC